MSVDYQGIQLNWARFNENQAGLTVTSFEKKLTCTCSHNHVDAVKS
jgi:hypothetical protein